MHCARFCCAIKSPLKFDNGLELLLSGSFYDSHGQDDLFFKAFDNPATNNGVAVSADDDEFHQLFANISWGAVGRGPLRAALEIPRLFYLQ